MRSFRPTPLLQVLLIGLLPMGCASAGGPNDDPSPDSGVSSTDASTAWSCFESPGILCLCDTGSHRELAACSTGWTCCLEQWTAERDICECYDKDEASCAETVAGDAGLVRVTQCPPG